MVEMKSSETNDGTVMVKQQRWNSIGLTVMVEHQWWKSGCGTVILEQQ